MQVEISLPKVFFKHFSIKNQLSGFYIRVTLAENELIRLDSLNIRTKYLATIPWISNNFWNGNQFLI